MTHKVRMSLRMPDNIYQDLKTKAEMKGNSVSSLIREAVTEYLYGGRVRE
jgi:predicted DNA-binding protein